MKCHKCGADNVDNAKYCIHCGEKLTVVSGSKMDEILNDLDNITNEPPSTPKQYSVDLSGVKDISDNELINQLNRAHIILKDAYAYFNDAATIKRNLNLNKYEPDQKKFFKTIVIELAKVFIVYIILGWIASNSRMFLIEICLVIMNFGIPCYIIYKAYVWYKKYTQERQQVINTQQSRVNQLNQKGTAILRSNVDVLNVVPENYWMPEAVKSIIGSLQVGRAKDLKEALDICDQYLIKVSNDQIRNQLQASEIEMVNQMQIIQSLQYANIFFNRF